VAVVGACVAGVVIGLAVLIPILTATNKGKSSDTTNSMTKIMSLYCFNIRNRSVQFCSNFFYANKISFVH
jgi:hypothetical protein